jgi:hypothetical protein
MGDDGMIRLVSIGRVSALLFSLLALAGSDTAISADAQTGIATFGAKPTFQSASNFEYIPSGDKQAFTVTFNPEFEAAVGGKITDTAAVGTRVFSFVVPVSGKDINASFTLKASVTAEEGAGGLLMLVVNDQQTVTRYKTREEREFLVTLNYRAKAASDLRITVFLLAERDAAHPTAMTLIHIGSTDGDLAVKKTGRKK